MHITLYKLLLYKFKLLCCKLNMHISKDLYSLQISQLLLTYCKLRRNVADIILLYDLLNGYIHSSELLSLIHFNIQKRCLRKF